MAVEPSFGRHFDRLLVRHLPPELSSTDKEDLLRQFGAVKVRLSSNNKQFRDDSAMAWFSSPSAAFLGLRRLHQLRVLSRFLVVEFGRESQERFFLDDPSETLPSTSRCFEGSNESASATPERTVTATKTACCSCSCNSTRSHPSVIPSKSREMEAESLFPPSSLEIVGRISNALLHLAPFYRNVLSLMRDMQLPAPFGNHHNIDAHIFKPHPKMMRRLFGSEATAVSPPPPPPPPPLAVQTNVNDSHSHEDLDRGKSKDSESELESDEEGDFKKKVEWKHLQPPRIRGKRNRHSSSPSSSSSVPLKRTKPLEETKRLILDRAVENHLKSTRDVSASGKHIVKAKPSIQMRVPCDLNTSMDRDPQEEEDEEEIRNIKRPKKHEDNHKSDTRQEEEDKAKNLSEQLEILPGLQPDSATSLSPLSQRATKELTQKPLQPTGKPTGKAAIPSTVDRSTLDSIPPSQPNDEPIEKVASTSGLDEPIEKVASTSGLDDPIIDSISFADIEKNRISREEMKITPVFKNYEAGEPNSKLYIKNLAKQVTEDELRRIFSNFVQVEIREVQLDIKLMTQGRMKGQAFVTFSSQDCAVKALSSTNGLMWRSRPMVVVFARKSLPSKCQ